VEPWKILFERALAILDAAGAETFWTMGGGTALMLRHNHRASKDVDIFFRDPQPLGYVTPRLGSVAEAMTSRYEESNDHVKLYFAEGEIDFVATPLLTSPGFVEHAIMGRSVRLETDVEIAAKKMWHRGHEAKARDIFDLSLVIERSPNELRKASRYLVRHREAFVNSIDARRDILKMQFESIDVRDYRPTFEHCVEQAASFLEALPDAVPGSARPRR
jgi:hypothetical protein